jgi:hypothetical protein
LGDENILEAIMHIVLTTAIETIRNFPQSLRHQPQPVSYDELFKDPKDGCALYDDVWGG